jgi:hypothetical protein
LGRSQWDCALCGDTPAGRASAEGEGEMKKSNAEPAIRRLCHEWANAGGFDPKSKENPSFADFKFWLAQKGHSHYLSFRSVRGADADAELRYDQELNQTWRN